MVSVRPDWLPCLDRLERDPIVTEEPEDEPTPNERLAALSEEERAVLAKVSDIVRKIRYGTVVLVIQDEKVVQIEMAEKFRLR